LKTDPGNLPEWMFDRKRIPLTLTLTSPNANLNPNPKAQKHF